MVQASSSVPKQGERPRRELVLRKVIAHLAKHGGVANLSLRALAQAVGTSHRMLIYYFGSKEGLLRAIYEDEGDRFIAQNTEVWMSDAPVREKLRAHWANVRANRKLLRVTGQIFGTALLNPAGSSDLVRRLGAQSLRDIEAIVRHHGVNESRVKPVARFARNALRGFEQDLLLVGEEKQIEEALDEFGAWLETVLEPVTSGD